MSKIVTPQRMVQLQQNNTKHTNTNEMDGNLSRESSVVDFDDFTTTSSIIEFLSKEQECCSDADADSIFQEVSRLADNSDTRSVDEILREAEMLIQQQSIFDITITAKSKSKEKQQSIKNKSKYEYVRAIEHSHPEIARHFNGPSVPSTNTLPVVDPITPVAVETPTASEAVVNNFNCFVENLPSESVISEESTPELNCTVTENVTFTAAQTKNSDDTDEGTDTMEEITEGIETIELVVNDELCLNSNGKNLDTNNVSHLNSKAHEPLHASNTNISLMPMSRMLSVLRTSIEHTKSEYITNRRPSVDSMLQAQQAQAFMPSPTHKSTLNFNATQACSPSVNERRNSGSAARRSSITTPDSGIASHTQSAQFTQTLSPHKNTFSPTPAVVKSFSDKSVNSSPKHMVSSVTSPIESMSFMTREHVLKQEIEQLQEKLKDTEERLQSLRIQHDSLAQLHRDLRENSSHLQEESEMLKLDVQHLNECANVLRTELKAARHDRTEALELQKVLQAELEETRQEKKRAQELKEKDTKVIQDLQRQCREMERILMRKHPDSVSALIVASKNPGKCTNNDQENLNSRKLLEQRIAQLEADAKAQDLKAQQILANVQARFNSVQAKYETHIADLETQVLSLQEINTKLNEKIESQVRTLDYFVSKKSEQYYNNSTQTDEIKIAEEVTENSASTMRVTTSACTQTANTKTSTRDHSTNTIGTSNQHSASSSTSSTANSTPNNSRPNSKQSGLRKPNMAISNALASKLPVSHSDSTISLSAYHAAAKEDAHLLATIRGMRIDLAIKDKAMQRLTRELDECKKTIKKLQREKDALKSDKPHSTPSTLSRRHYDASHNADQTPANTESQALREAQNKIKLLEADYKTLHDKRLQDLKSLQTAHERELASCHETVRILQQRLNERDEAFALQKRRKMPVDYYALKAKVSSLERRHSEREERLHMLVEALSKGRLNGALEEMLADNNNK